MTFFRDIERKVEHAWSIRDACEGTQIFGATGSGKTTGSGYHLATRMLAKGFGGLVLCAKSDEADNWREYLREVGRLEDDLVELAPDQGQRFDFMDYEFQAGKGAKLTQNLVALFSTAIAATGGDDRGSSTDPYWADALRQLVTNAIDLAGLANESVRLADVNRIVTTAPPNRQVRAYLRSDAYTAQCLRRANERSIKDEFTPDELVDLEQTIEYWLNDFAGLAPRTRSIIVSSFTSRVTGLLRGPLARLFCPADEPKEGEQPFTVRPEDTRQGKVIVLNLPIKDYGEVGRFAQILFKTIWQRAIERLEVKPPADKPVFLWADESQYFVTNHDVLYQQTARSKKAATVYLTQSLPNYYSMLATRDPVSATHSLLGNLQTKIFHANGDPTTNEWAERLFGTETSHRGSRSINHATGRDDIQLGRSVQETREPIVPARLFTTLRKGGPGPPNHSRVGAIVFQGGRGWAAEAKEDPCQSADVRKTGTHVLRTWFDQPERMSGPVLSKSSG